MRANPYLTFDGQCENAFRYYERVLGGKIEMMLSHGASPVADEVPAAWRDRIMHARLVVDEVVLMGSDAPPDRVEKPQGFSVSLLVDDPSEAERIFHALAEQGTVRMPFGETFWAHRFGMLVDRFGIPWMVNCERAS